MRNLFNVREEVILQSKSHPELNGEYTVLMAVRANESVKCPITGLSMRSSFDFGLGYVLDMNETETDVNGITTCIFWLESALRKKYPPSDKSFEEMKQEMRGNVKVVECS